MSTDKSLNIFKNLRQISHSLCFKLFFEKHSGRDSSSYIQHTDQTTGVGRRTVFRVPKELRENGTLSSPQRSKRGQYKPVDDFNVVVYQKQSAGVSHPTPSASDHK